MKTRQYDFVIVGGGITGLTIASELKKRYPDSRLLLLEKETELGRHGSGLRNSGVLHSGIYYPERSLKAQLCSAGSQAMEAYCDANSLPIHRIGKIIVPTRRRDDGILDMLLERAAANKARAVTLIDEKQLRELDPEVRTASGRALMSPHTAVVDPMAVLGRLYKDLKDQGAEILLGHCVHDVDPDKSMVFSQDLHIGYRWLINAAGQHSDILAKRFGVGKNYVLLPFRGLYYKLDPSCGIRPNHLVYPVPDMNFPFLGVHSVTTISGDVYFGPSATPAFGRENYTGLKGVELLDAMSIGFHLLNQYRLNEQNFRRFAHEEAGRNFKTRFAAAVCKLIPSVPLASLKRSTKVGIRAQLLDKTTHRLVMDFLIESMGNTVHVLNSVSPAFSSSFAFAEYLVSKYQFEA
jgi:L-2-hydroxyglutarate oxidase LhgO